MRQIVAPFCAAEAMDSEHDLLRGETSPLRTAAGFVLGSALCGAFWAMACLLAWSLA